MFPHGVSSGSNNPLSGFVEGFLNGVFIDQAKIRPELLKVNGLRGDGMFVLSKGGDEGMLNSPLKTAKFIYPGVMGTASPEVVGWVSSRTEGSHSWGPVSNTWG